MSDRLEVHQVHQSLLRTPLFAGVEFGILMIEVSFGVGVWMVGGFSLASLAPALVVILAVHIPMRKLLRADPALVAIVPTALRYKRFYPPVSVVHGRSKNTRAVKSIRFEARV